MVYNENISLAGKHPALPYTEDALWPNVHVVGSPLYAVTRLIVAPCLAAWLQVLSWVVGSVMT